MKTILTVIKSMFATPSAKAMENEYYCDAVDIVDLERRMRLVQRGQAPYQRPAYHSSF